MSGVVEVTITSLSAMAKIFLMGTVGVLCAWYPKGSPLLSVSTLQHLSKLLNLVNVPALSAASLGTSLTLAGLGRYWLLIPCCLGINSISYILAWTLGKLIHEGGDEQLYQASVVAVGSPNALALPIIILETLCETDTINAEFGSVEECKTETRAMLFVYLIGWQLMFWGYGYPSLQQHLKG
eukprot:CAMPEP_0173300422 /NCGR_PEP_ID=MMETSP1143-20121109/17218_1 /TAXON_ID=483371 /ORGANISM="non described non described, Strain CCMP2298" /LENGTH=181 /DNA_ID=CAMNT_0014240805 /DNA_START=154 /DNA_END=695 /DNA_ORIENTATION=-